jgi:anti-anti-sigma factor
MPPDDWQRSPRKLMPERLIVSSRQAQREAIMALAERVSCIVLDFSLCRYVESAALGMLMRCVREARRDHACGIVFANLSEDLDTMLNITQMDQYVPLVRDIEGEEQRGASSA